MITNADIGAAAIRPRISEDAPVGGIRLPGNVYAPWRELTRPSGWPRHCFDHSRLARLRREKGDSVFSFGQPRNHASWGSFLMEFQTEVGWAANAFIHLSLRDALQEAQAANVDATMRVLLDVNQQNRAVAAHINDAFVKGIRRAFLDVEEAFRQVGERLRDERVQRVNELAGQRAMQQQAAAQNEKKRSKKELIAFNRAKNLQYEWLLAGPPGVSKDVICDECGESGHRRNDKSFCLASETYGIRSRNSVMTKIKEKKEAQKRARSPKLPEEEGLNS